MTDEAIMNLAVEAYAGELKKLRETNEKFTNIFKHSNPEKYEGVYFICGEGGDRDGMGLPEKLFVCPAYGLDGMAIYTKTSEYSAPEW